MVTIRPHGPRPQVSRETKPHVSGRFSGLLTPMPPVRPFDEKGIEDYVKSNEHQFERKRSQIYKDYPAGSFVLFENGRVRDHDTDGLKLMIRQYERRGIRPLFIQQIPESPPVGGIVTMSSDSQKENPAHNLAQKLRGGIGALKEWVASKLKH